MINKEKLRILIGIFIGAIIGAFIMMFTPPFVCLIIVVILSLTFVIDWDKLNEDERDTEEKD